MAGDPGTVTKPKLAVWKFASCDGCQLTVLDCEDELLALAGEIDFAYFPGQSYAGNPWSAWGDSTFADGKYYASLGDHRAPAGTAFVYEYDPAKKSFRQLIDLQKLLALVFCPGCNSPGCLRKPP